MSKQPRSAEYVLGFEAKSKRYKPSLRKRHELTAADMVDIISYWKAHSPSMAELGHKFEITRVLAQQIVRSFKLDPLFLARLRAKEQLQEDKVEKVKETVKDLLDAGKHVWSIASLQKLASPSEGKQVSRKIVAHVLRDIYAMSYRKILHTANLANTD